MKGFCNHENIMDAVGTVHIQEVDKCPHTDALGLKATLESWNKLQTITAHATWSPGKAIIVFQGNNERYVICHRKYTRPMFKIAKNEVVFFHGQMRARVSVARKICCLVEWTQRCWNGGHFALRENITLARTAIHLLCEDAGAQNMQMNQNSFFKCSGGFASRTQTSFQLFTKSQ